MNFELWESFNSYPRCQPTGTLSWDFSIIWDFSLVLWDFVYCFSIAWYSIYVIWFKNQEFMLDKILQVTLKRIEMKTVSSQRNKILLLEEDFKKQEKRCILRPTEVTIVSQWEGILCHILRTIDANKYIWEYYLLLWRAKLLDGIGVNDYTCIVFIWSY